MLVGLTTAALDVAIDDLGVALLQPISGHDERRNSRARHAAGKITLVHLIPKSAAGRLHSGLSPVVERKLPRLIGCFETRLLGLVQRQNRKLSAAIVGHAFVADIPPGAFVL